MNDSFESEDFFEEEIDSSNGTIKTRPDGSQKLVISLLAAIILLVSALAYLQYFNKSSEVLPVVEAIAEGTGSTLLKDPLGIATYKDKFYVTDASNARVLVFLDDGSPLYDFSGGSLHDKPKLMLKYPNSIAVNSEGKVYIADIETGKIIEFSESGRALESFPLIKDRKQKIKPLALTFDDRDRFYVAEANTGSIYIFNKEGELSNVIGKGELKFPNGIAVSKDGDIYVSDSNAQQVLIFSESGALKKRFARGEDKRSFLPRGMAFTNKGNLLVADTLSSEIVEFDKDGKEISSWGKPGVEDDELTFPNGIAYANGKLFIVDRGNNRVLMVRNFPK